jgi:hypothetical protein
VFGLADIFDFFQKDMEGASAAPGEGEGEEKREENVVDLSDDTLAKNREEAKVHRLKTFKVVRPLNKTSLWWTHFGVYVEKEGKGKAVCLLCKGAATDDKFLAQAEVSQGQSGTTANLTQHMRTHHRGDGLVSGCQFKSSNPFRKHANSSPSSLTFLDGSLKLSTRGSLKRSGRMRS